MLLQAGNVERARGVMQQNMRVSHPLPPPETDTAAGIPTLMLLHLLAPDVQEGLYLQAPRSPQTGSSSTGLVT